MIETSITAWIWMLAAMLASSGAGLALVRFVPWSDAAREAGIPRAFAFAIAPFLLGMLAVIALGVFRGASHAFHLGVVFVGLLLLCSTVAFSRPLPKLERPGTPLPIGLWEWVFGGLLAVWVILLIADTLFMPLMQNDALEYATVGRLLFELRDLLAYPALDPAVGTSGFYGPWTHPPLYIALSYIANVFQGHADAPGLMRLISPWCALAAATVVYSTGRLVSRITGLLSALLFLSTPLLFLGAGAALIDPLPVLGMTLVLCTVTMVEGTPVRRGAVQGLTLGLALWTHSQAVLLGPLALIAVMQNSGSWEKRALTKQPAVMFGVAALMAAWPYGRNLVLFGSPISDNPAVFAIRDLYWPEYFSLKRGLDSSSEKIQYGILKGWFAVEAYGLSFWFATLGVVACLVMPHRRQGGNLLLRGEGAAGPKSLTFVAIAMVFIYLAGTVMSVLLGIDLMIRNERYLLMIMPPVALLAAVGIGWITAQTTEFLHTPGMGSTRMGARAGKAIQIAFLVLLLAQLVVVGAYRWVTSGCFDSSLGSCREAVPHQSASYGAADFMRNRIPPDAFVITLKPADMYYSERRMLSYLDPRLIALYREIDADRAWRTLRAMGVTHLHMPDYSLPPLYNSALQEMIGRPELTRLLFSSGGYQIYELCEGMNPAAGNTLHIGPGEIPWTQVRQLALGGRKSLFRLTLSTQALERNGTSLSDYDLPLFLRERTTVLLSERMKIPGSVFGHDAAGTPEANEYGLELVLEGRALAQVRLMQYDSNGRLLDDSLMGEMALGQQYPKRRFFRRFFAHPNASAFRFGVEHRGNSMIRIHHASLAVFYNGDAKAFRPVTEHDLSGVPCWARECI